MVCKNKFVNFVGEYYFDLIVSYGVVFVIVFCVLGVFFFFDSFEFFYGVLLCEGEDVDLIYYMDSSEFFVFIFEEFEEIKVVYSSDMSIDRDKDLIEL